MNSKALSLLAFIVLATLNSAGYRYGASDQAFYAPAILARANPALYPRDADLIRAQAQLTLVDDVVAPILRGTGISLATLFGVLYLLALIILAFAATRIAGSLYQTHWAMLALLAAMTLRHAIIRSGTNTLEGYFHPRQLSFAIGALAIASFLRAGYRTAFALVAVASALHPTTGLWLAIWIVVATFVAERKMRRPLALAAAVGAVVGGWALLAGPLAGRLVRMDEPWYQTLAERNYLFPLEWPATAWLVNLAYIPAIVWMWRLRRAAGRSSARETGLVVGCLTLVLVFAALLPLNAARVALAIQLQPARMFWMLDFLAVIYVVWALAEYGGAREARARIVAIALAMVSVVRGTYVKLVEFPDRPIAQVVVRDDDWGRAMAWARASDPGSGWLADPLHAVLYGTSVRVAGERDVFIEPLKDGAVGMYDRAIALRTRDRIQELGDFGALTSERARDLGARHGLDYFVSERTFDLPVAFASGAIRVYRLR
jgi:hypothetical protein